MPHFPVSFNPVALVNSVGDPRSKFTPVGSMALSALGGKDLSILGADLVGWWKGSFVKIHISYLDPESVALSLDLWLSVACPGLNDPVKVDFRSDVLERGIDEPVFEKRVEGSKVGLKGIGESRVGRPVCGRILEEMVAT